MSSSVCVVVVSTILVLAAVWGGCSSGGRPPTTSTPSLLRGPSAEGAALATGLEPIVALDAWQTDAEVLEAFSKNLAVLALFPDEPIPPHWDSELTAMATYLDEGFDLTSDRHLPAATRVAWAIRLSERAAQFAESVDAQVEFDAFGAACREARLALIARVQSVSEGARLIASGDVAGALEVAEAGVGTALTTWRGPELSRGEHRIAARGVVPCMSADDIVTAQDERPVTVTAFHF